MQLEKEKKGEDQYPQSDSDHNCMRNTNNRHTSKVSPHMEISFMIGIACGILIMGILMKLAHIWNII